MFSGARQPQHARTAVRLLPREEEFFDLFVEVATRSTVAAQHLRELFDAPPDRRIAHVEAINRGALGRSCETGRAALEVSKGKEISNNPKSPPDQGEDVANVLESTPINHA